MYHNLFNNFFIWAFRLFLIFCSYNNATMNNSVHMYFVSSEVYIQDRVRSKDKCIG